MFPPRRVLKLRKASLWCQGCWLLLSHEFLLLIIVLTSGGGGWGVGGLVFEGVGVFEGFFVGGGEAAFDFFDVFGGG